MSIRKWQSARMTRDLQVELEYLRQAASGDASEYAALLAMQGALQSMAPILNREQRAAVEALLGLAKSTR